MAEAKPFPPAKLIAGIIFSQAAHREAAEKSLAREYGLIDLKSGLFPFELTDYYEKEMGSHLTRMFLSFAELIAPEELSRIKLRTNELEEDLRLGFGEARRIVNIDPGILTSSALIMATAKDFSHRIPLQHGIYAHLELLFTKAGVRVLDWTYPDFKQPEYQEFFLSARRIYLAQRRAIRSNSLR